MAGVLVTPASSSTKIYSPIFVKSRSPHFSRKSSHCLSLPLNAGFKKRGWFPSTLRASVGTQEYVVEPSTNVKFPMSLAVPGSNNSLTLFGTGYREKVFAIIGVKVYAAGLYSDGNIVGELAAWKGKSATQIQEDGGFFTSALQSIQIVLVRDVDGKTFWDALNDAISPRIKNPTPVDELALSKFRETFQERPLKQGNVILLTWTQPSKMLVSISADGVHFNVDHTIDSSNVSSSLFYVYFGESPVSPSLKESVASGLASSI